MKLSVLSSLIFHTLFIVLRGEDEWKDHIASIRQTEDRELRRCQYGLHKLWSQEISHSPFAAPPLITDVDADGKLDIIAASFTEAVTVLEGEHGSVQRDWPIHFTDRSFHSSPLQFDIYGDGLLDILLLSTDGELLFYTATAQPLPEYTFTIPPVYVKSGWFKQVLTVSHQSVHDFILDGIPRTQDGEYIAVDPHVLATPCITDLNGDDRIEELVIPVSFYYDTQDYRLVERVGSEYNISSQDLDKYLVSAVVTVNLTSLQVLHTVHLDLTQVTAVFPGYLLASPTVIDLDSKGGAMEIVVATGAGNLHVIESTGSHRQGFPISTNSHVTQVLAGDVLDEGTLQLVTVDSSGNVACYRRTGELVWESEVSGAVVAGARFTDIDANGGIDIVITTEDGAIHVLEGRSGSEVPGWPLQLGVHATANVLLTKLNQHTQSSTDIIILGDDGNLYLVSNDLKCRHHISIGETSLVQVVSHDIVSQSEGLELLIATNDGSLMCFGNGFQQGFMGDISDQIIDKLHSVPAELKTHNDFYYGVNKTGIAIIPSTKGIIEISSNTFWLHFFITGLPPKRGEFQIKVYFGRHLLSKTSHSGEPGEYFLSVPSWLVPSHGHVTVYLSNQHGQIFSDSLPVRFFHSALWDLQWLLSAPFLALCILVLILHGFPAKDLLPVTIPTKSR